MRASPCNDCEHKDRDKNHYDCVACKKRIEYNNSLGCHSESVPIEVNLLEEIKLLKNKIKTGAPVQTKAVQSEKDQLIEACILEEIKLLENKKKPRPPVQTKDVQSEKDQLIEACIADCCKDAGITLNKLRGGFIGKSRPEELQSFHKVRDRIIKKLASGDFGILTQAEIGKYLGVTNHVISTRMNIIGVSPMHPSSPQKKPRKSPKKKKHKPPVTAKALHVKTAESTPEKPGFNLITIDFSSHQEILGKICEIAQSELRTPENQVLYWLINCDFEKIE